MKKHESNVVVVIIILSFSVALALASVSWEASDELSRDQKRHFRTCEEQCERQEPYFEEQLCRKRCQEIMEGGRDDQDLSIKGVGNQGDDARVEYEQCQEKCRGTGKKQWQCQRKCHDQYQTALERERQKRRQREREHEHKHEHKHEDEGHGGGDREPKDRHDDYRHCLEKCDDDEEGVPRQRQCKLQCEDEFGQHREGHRHSRQHHHGNSDNDNSHDIKTKKEQKTDNPYYFNSQSFESRYSTKEGQMKLLQRFSEKSDLLLGIDSFRVGFYVANPNSFLLPHHWDADSVLFIIKGKATMTLLKQKTRETFNLKRGDVVMIRAGTTAYLVSTHKDEELHIAELLRPVNSPGHYEQFFGVGSGESKSFFNIFSTEILEAALRVPRDDVDKLLKQHKEKAIVKASQEQVRRLAHGMSKKQFGSSKGPYNLLNDQPQMHNEHGEFYEVTSNEYQLLEDLDVSVAYCEIKQGSMMAPHYNSRATYVVLVEQGSGYFEIASPHLVDESNKKQHGSSQKYKKVGSHLSTGDLFVVPAGHPVAIVASKNESIRAIGFGINAQHNQRNFITGQGNIINQLDEVAMELSFGLPAKEVEKMFRKQTQSYFMAGPRQQHNALISLLDFAGF